MTSSCIPMPRPRFILLASAAALAMGSACGVRPATRAAPRLPALAATAGTPGTTGPWAFGASYDTQGITITTHAIVVISGDPATRTDTLSATLDASYAWVRSAGLRVSGSLTDYRVATGDAVPAAPAGLTRNSAFAAEASPADGTLAFQLPAESSACTDPALSALQGLHDAWIPLPDTLRLGDEWSDTVHTLSCRNRLFVRGTIGRQFRVQRAEIETDRVILLIDRRSKGRMTAEGEQFGEQVSLDGEHLGTMQYVLDVASGRLLRGHGTSALDLTFKSRRRTQRVTQDSELMLLWNP